MAWDGAAFRGWASAAPTSLWAFTTWDWSTPDKYMHDLISTDRNDPTVNANGLIYGATEESTPNFPWLDPKTHKVGTIHGGMTAEQKQKTVEAWQDGKVDIIVGTKSPTAGQGTFEIWQSDNAANPTFSRLETYPTAGGIPGNSLGEEAGAALAAHPGIDFISFTGSNEVGTLVQQAAAKNAVKCVLELGGKSPQIVFEDVDADRAVPIIVRAIVQNAGQTCTAGSRLLVQRERVVQPRTDPLAAQELGQRRVGRARGRDEIRAVGQSQAGQHHGSPREVPRHHQQR